MYIGIDWGGTKMEVIGLDAGGVELIRHRIPTPREDYDASIRAVVDLVAHVETAAGERGGELSGLSAEELDCFIPHQANNRITDSMLRHLKLPEDVVVGRDIIQMGNSSAASIPLAMEELLESGQAHSGDSALIIGFGAGLVFGAQVVVLP